MRFDPLVMPRDVPRHISCARLAKWVRDTYGQDAWNRMKTEGLRLSELRASGDQKTRLDKLEAYLRARDGW